jgi:hypothetical protein
MGKVGSFPAIDHQLAMVIARSEWIGGEGGEEQ